MSDHSNTILSPEQEIESLQAEIDSLKRQLQENERTMAKMDETVSAAETNLLQMQARESEQYKRADDLQRKCERLESQNERSAMRSLDYQTQIEKLTAELAISKDLAWLDLSWPCSPEDIANAYQNAVKAIHDDVGSERILKKVQAAYENLQRQFSERNWH